MARDRPSGLLDFSKDWRNVYPTVYPQWSFIQVLAGVERRGLRTVNKAHSNNNSKKLRPQPKTQFNSQGEFDFFF